MKKGFKNIAIVYLLVAIVFASNGFQVYSSFCHCTKTETLSIFKKSDCCNEDKSESCSTVTIKTECCSQSTVFIKFSEQYIPTFRETLLKAIYTTSIPFYNDALKANILTNIISEHPFSDEPPIPKLFGKTMVYRFHSIKIPCA